MSSVVEITGNTLGINPRTVQKCRQLDDSLDHPTIKVLNVEREIDRLGGTPQDQALCYIALARLLLDDPDNASIPREAYGRGEEGAEVTIGRKPATTALLRASTCLRLLGSTGYLISTWLTDMAFHPNRTKVDEVYCTLIS